METRDDAIKLIDNRLSADTNHLAKSKNVQKSGYYDIRRSSYVC